MKISPLSCVIGFLGLAGTAAAQVVFTVHATANGDALGYVGGQSYSFRFTVSNGFGSSGSSVFNPTRNSWQEEFTADGPLWLSVGGGGLGGGYSRPNEAEDAPTAKLTVNEPGELILEVGTNTFLGDIGLTAPDASRVAGIGFVLAIDTTDFTFPGTYSSPGDYFAGLEGAYTGGGSGLVAGPVVFSGSQAEFTFTGLTISASPIPEPASVAVLAGLGALALVNTRRRRRAV